MDSRRDISQTIGKRALPVSSITPIDSAEMVLALTGEFTA